MSRIGKKPIDIPDKVKVGVNGDVINVEGPLGKLEYRFRSGDVKVAVEGKQIVVNRLGDFPQDRAYHGLTRALINNMVNGVTKGYKKTLDIVGVGWRGEMKGAKISLQIGFCHNVDIEIPKGLKVELPQATRIVITGPDKHLVGQFAANVRAVRPPEPYNQKGIRYDDEVVRKKAGKAAVGAGG